MFPPLASLPLKRRLPRRVWSNEQNIPQILLKQGRRSQNPNKAATVNELCLFSLVFKPM